MTKKQIQNKMKTDIKMVELEIQISKIIKYYYPKEQKPSRLWEIVCDTLDIDYDDETIGEYFDEIIKKYK
jgi:hypothetical protein